MVCQECRTQTVTAKYGKVDRCNVCTNCGRIVKISDWGIKVLRKSKGYWWEKAS